MREKSSARKIAKCIGTGSCIAITTLWTLSFWLVVGASSNPYPIGVRCFLSHGRLRADWFSGPDDWFDTFRRAYLEDAEYRDQLGFHCSAGRMDSPPFDRITTIEDALHTLGFVWPRLAAIQADKVPHTTPPILDYRMELPMWLLLLPIGIPTAYLWHRDSRMHKQGHCQHCGYNLTANQSGACPECGTSTRATTDSSPNGATVVSRAAEVWESPRRPPGTQAVPTSKP